MLKPMSRIDEIKKLLNSTDCFPENEVDSLALAIALSKNYIPIMSHLHYGSHPDIIGDLLFVPEVLSEIISYDRKPFIQETKRRKIRATRDRGYAIREMKESCPVWDRRVITPRSGGVTEGEIESRSFINLC